MKTSAVKKLSGLGSEAAPSLPQVPPVSITLITNERNYSHIQWCCPHQPCRVGREALLGGEMWWRQEEPCRCELVATSLQKRGQFRISESLST